MAEDLQQMYARALGAHERYDFEQAVSLYEQILAQHPDADLVLYNQGLALYELARFTEAAAVFSRAADIRTDDIDIWFNLGLALKQAGCYQQARSAYERALELAPDDADILFNLANCCREGGFPAKAAACYEQLLNLEPDHAAGLNNYAYLCHLQGEYEQAEELYQRLLLLRPDHPGARHMVAALQGTADSTPASSYIQDLFDQYSDSFEQSLLEKLEYRVPELLFDLVAHQGTGSFVFVNGVDLGCGTGLAGQLFSSLCNRLTGVDLSEKMVAVAADKGVYDTLVTADVVQFLQQTTARYDLFIAADLLTYLADLEPLFQALVGKSLPSGRFVFSTEHGREPGWQVRPTGRFAHHLDYIRKVVGSSGGEIVTSREVDLRREGESWIRGDIYLAVFNRK